MVEDWYSGLGAHLSHEKRNGLTLYYQTGCFIVYRDPSNGLLQIP